MNELQTIFYHKCFLKDLHILKKYDPEKGFTMDLEMRLTSDCYFRSDDESTVRFYHVEQLEMKALHHALRMFLELYNLKEYQYEYLRYQIVDEENGVLSFLCESFEILD